MQNTLDDTKEAGLRDRKKAKRRGKILLHSRALFSKNGIDATTMADIADAVGVSTPTIFNYFGNKDGILIALISEGTKAARALERTISPRNDTDFATIIISMFARVSERTLKIASKRIWRYAEAAAIRHPRTPLSKEYAAVDRGLVESIIEFFGNYEMRMRAGTPADPRLIGKVFFDVWNSLFLALIKDEKMDMTRHRSEIETCMRPLANLLFTDSFLRKPKLRKTRNINAES